MGIFDDLRLKYNTGQLPVKFIFINVALFLVVRLADVCCILLGSTFSAAPYLELPSDLTVLLHRPYTLLTYMFFHYDVLHLLFNMLWLYWFGQLFLLFFNAKQFGGLYILGGISGALLYLLAYNLLPYFADSRGMLLGASAAVLAVVLAVSAYAPDYKIRLLLLGNVSLKYIALATVVLDLLSMTSHNAGGHIAHLGGALFGYLFATSYKKGRDLTKGFNRLADQIVLLFKKRPRKGGPKIRTSRQGYARNPSDDEYLRRRQENTAEIDRILDKIKQSGYTSLSREEKQRLFDAGKK